MRLLVLCSLWALALSGAGPVGTATAQPLPPPPGSASVYPLADRPVSTEPLDLDGAASRREALGRLAGELSVHRVPTRTPAQCTQAVNQAIDAGAYQVFVERQDLVPALAPLAFDMGLRDRVDAVRLAPVCQVATAVVVTRFSDRLRRTQDPVRQRDYAVALVVADWAQAKADGLGAFGGEVPADIVADPFGVLRAAPVANPVTAP